jgi:Ca2+-binding EF-hand superfamily protein
MARTGTRAGFANIRSMKLPGLSPRFLSATLFLIGSLATSASAQEMMSSSQPAKGAQRGQELLKRYDRNGDGKLDDDERADAKELMLKEQVDRQMARAAALPGGLEQFRAEALQMFDRNRDGRLDDEERMEAQKFAREREGGVDGRDELTKHFDRNRDGTIDDEERSRMQSFLTALRGLGSVQMRFELLRRFDVNADARIDEREFTELEKFVRPRVEASPDQLRRHDTNRDGKLDDAEWIVARATIAEWLNGTGAAASENEMKSESSAGVKTSAEVERARLKTVAEEVQRRRAERAKP